MHQNNEVIYNPTYTPTHEITTPVFSLQYESELLDHLICLSTARRHSQDTDSASSESYSINSMLSNSDDPPPCCQTPLNNPTQTTHKNTPRQVVNTNPLIVHTYIVNRKIKSQTGRCHELTVCTYSLYFVHAHVSVRFRQLSKESYTFLYVVCV